MIAGTSRDDEEEDLLHSPSIGLFILLDRGGSDDMLILLGRERERGLMIIFRDSVRRRGGGKGGEERGAGAG